MCHLDEVKSKEKNENIDTEVANESVQNCGKDEVGTPFQSGAKDSGLNGKQSKLKQFSNGGKKANENLAKK